MNSYPDEWTSMNKKEIVEKMLSYRKTVFTICIGFTIYNKYCRDNFNFMLFDDVLREVRC